MGHSAEGGEIDVAWDEFLTATNNPVAANYGDIFPNELLEELAENVYEGCKNIDLRVYADQLSKDGQPISKVLNDAWVSFLKARIVLPTGKNKALKRSIPHYELRKSVKV